MKINYALVSVSDKNGIVKLCKFLENKEIKIISTGGTKKVLDENGISTISIEEFSGRKEILGGRVKTLGYELYASLLYNRNESSDCDEVKNLNIPAIDLVVCNLYPFASTLKNTKDFDKLIENVDIGGPTMIRAAAKNHDAVTVLSSPSHYDKFIAQYEINSNTDLSLRRSLAIDAFSMVSRYDQLIATSLAFESDSKDLKEAGENYSLLRYGENPHQKGIAFYDSHFGLGACEVIHGKAMSFNNYLDSDAAISTLRDLSTELSEYKSSVVIKHGNPCGVASCKSALESIENAWRGDPVSAFGSVIALSFEVDADVATFISERFIEVLLAPSFSDEALNILKLKKNLRLINTNELFRNSDFYQVKSITGGFLVQDLDTRPVEEFKEVTNSNLAIDKDLAIFSNICVKGLKSNAICLTKKIKDGLSLVGAGMGNPNRLISTEQAFSKAKENGVTSFSDVYLTSDAFFPFPDNVELAAKYQLKTIIQPGGSIKDNLVIDCANENNINMYFTGQRHFNH
tara:strand:- start:29967 stop:31514 length:1548 start_codon:yes stop_codon:yes gene_type:complete